MAPTFAESSVRGGRFAWLFGTLCASVVALVALRPDAPAPSTASYAKYDRYKPVKKCIGGRWVLTPPRHQRMQGR